MTVPEITVINSEEKNIGKTPLPGAGQEIISQTISSRFENKNDHTKSAL